MAEKTLTWRQVNAWRLWQHALSPRLTSQNLVEAVSRSCGIQAQVMSAAEQAILARVDGLSPQAVRTALWQDHTLVKTWAMRGTLHLIPTSELPLYVAARSVHNNRNWTGYFSYYGITPAQFEIFIDAIPRILGSVPMTHEQLANALTEHTGFPELGKLIHSKSWGTPLKPSAWRGDLCFGPSQGQNVTYVHPGQWIGQSPPIEPYLALQEITRRYLRTYGPSTPENFYLWWGASGMFRVRKLFESINEDLEKVDIEGWPVFALKSTHESILNAVIAGVVRLLPLFDAYVLGLSRVPALAPLLPPVFYKRVFRPQGWISAGVLVDGEIKGVWNYKIQRGQLAVRISLFSPPTIGIQNGIEAEAERLGAFFNAKVFLAYED